MYKCLEHFTDLKDNRYEYNPGDSFPRDGYEADQARLEELSTNANKRGRPVIKLIEEPKKVEDNPFFDMPEPKEPMIPDKPKRGRRKKNAD